MATTFIDFENDIDLENKSWTKVSENLVGIYVEDDNSTWYMVTDTHRGKMRIRKMSIKRDINHARAIYRKAKGLIGKEIFIAVAGDSNPNIWFNDIEVSSMEGV
jgi:hypothetical protein